MEQTQRKDLRYTKTEEAIQAVFEELVAERPFEEITVSELTKRARINRKTFYLHYPSLEALLMAQRSALSARSMEKIRSFEIPSDLRGLICTLYVYWGSLSDRERRIWTCSSDRSIGLDFYAQMKRAKLRYSADFHANDGIRPFLSAYLADTITMIYREWHQDHPETSIEQAVDAAYSLILRGIGDGTAG